MTNVSTKSGSEEPDPAVKQTELFRCHPHQ